MTITSSLSEPKYFDRMKTVRSEQMVRKPCRSGKMPVKWNCSYCGYGPPLRQCPAYGKKGAECGKTNHSIEVCRSKKGKAVHNLELEPNLNQEEVKIEMVNINSTSLNSKHSVNNSKV